MNSINESSADCCPEQACLLKTVKVLCQIEGDKGLFLNLQRHQGASEKVKVNLVPKVTPKWIFKWQNIAFKYFAEIFQFNEEEDESQTGFIYIRGRDKA